MFIAIIKNPNIFVTLLFGAHDADRTRDLVLTKDVLYQLSYVGPIPTQFKRQSKKGNKSQIFQFPFFITIGIVGSSSEIRAGHKIHTRSVVELGPEPRLIHSCQGSLPPSIFPITRGHISYEPPCRDFKFPLIGAQVEIGAGDGI